jgi:hypothetical protein
MGVVFKARQSSLKRTVAVKMIRSGALADGAEVRRFRAEAEAAAGLKHPHIVAIHEIGEHEGRHYFSMDLIEGRNLAQAIGGKPVAPKQAAEWLKAIAEAVQFAHQRGVMHRDLKPQNILVDAEGRPHVTDFGLARSLHADSSLTRTGTVMGSPSYMSPEQARGRNDQVGPHSDVYSLGAILYELLTGRPPFKAASMEATLMMVANEEPLAPRRIHPNAPVDLETICLKCLEKSPQLRYATARELADDLARFLRHEPILARPVAASRKAEQWAKRHPMFLAGAAALMLLAVSALAYGLWQQNRYLVWQAAHPEAVRDAGPRTAQVKALESASGWMFLIGIWAFLLFNQKLRGVPLRKMFDTHWMVSRPVKPASPRALGAYELLGAGCVGFGLFYLAKLIDAVVWEAYGRQAAWGTIYAVMYFGGALLVYVRRERRAQRFGRDAGAIDASRVPAELTDRIGALLRDGLTVDAVRIYREATGCTMRDATTALDNIARQCGLPGIPAARISVSKLLRNLAITVAALCVALYLAGPAWRMPLLLQFSGGCVFTFMLIIGVHFKGFLKRWLPAVAGAAFYAWTLEIQRSAFPEHPAYWLSFVGLLVGAALVVTAHTTSRAP